MIAKPPTSASSFWASVLALAGACAVTGAIFTNDLTLPGFLAGYSPIVPCAVVALSLGLFEILRRPFAKYRSLSMERVALRLLGLAATLAGCAFLYWLFPEYHGTWYAQYWRFLKLAVYLIPLVPLYLAWADTRIRDPEDALLQCGRALLGRWDGVDVHVLRQHALGWLVKAFFLPLMTVYLADEMRNMGQIVRSATDLWDNYPFWFHGSYFIDLLFCVVGYSMTLRLTDSHIRSVEPTLIGWAAALVCYQPFYSVISDRYLGYEGGRLWDAWLAPWPHLQDVWGFCIGLLVMIYAAATVAFGLRFSNLTHRGIITSGPYRFSKHPAYLAKNLSWWMISVPFIQAGSLGTNLRYCALLLLLNGIYYLRARTEEWHLSRDPAYVAYAEWIDEHGLLSWLGRWLPVLRFRKPPQAASRPA